MLRTLQHMENSSLCISDPFLLAPEPPADGEGWPGWVWCAHPRQQTKELPTNGSVWVD